MMWTDCDGIGVLPDEHVS